MRKLLGGTAVDQASDRAIAAGADDQQIERCAVRRQLLGRLAVGRVRFDAAQAAPTRARLQAARQIMART
jgi:hypothetical protein